MIELLPECAWVIRRLSPRGFETYWRAGARWSPSARDAAVFCSERDAEDQVRAMRASAPAGRRLDVIEAVPLEGALIKEGEAWRVR